MKTSDVVVVGAGLAGLTTASILGRAGRQVTLVERSRLGGRATTFARDGYRFNVGAHALYQAGPGKAILAELGIKPQGRVPATKGSAALYRGALYRLPAGPGSLLATRLLSVAAKVEAGSFLARLGKLDTRAIEHVTVQAWLDEHLAQPETRALLLALVRVATYSSAPERVSAGAAFAQLRLAVHSGVLYLDGGWQTVVDALERTARAAGVELVATKVNQVRRLAHDHVEVTGDEGLALRARDVVLALAPSEVARLIGPAAPAHSEADLVRAACLDVALSRLPNSRTPFVLGIDRPLYLSVHSVTADLAPPGGAVIHLMTYLGSAKPDARTTRDELEALLDLAQPGWREVLCHQRFLPSMRVANRHVDAAGGWGGRPGPRLEDNLYVAGDWVGSEGMLADASLSSARAAAQAILQADQYLAAEEVIGWGG